MIADLNTSPSALARLRWRLAALALLVLGLLLWASAPLSEVPTLVNLAVNTKGALVLSAFGGAGPEPLDLSGFPGPIRKRLETYSARRRWFRSRLPEPAPSTTAYEIWSARVLVERAIIALIDVQGIEDQAATYASRARLGSRWNDASQEPLAEAQDVEAYLDANPATPLRPYLWLFLMHRYKAALPLLRSLGIDDGEIGGTTMKYARCRALAAGSSDPLIRLIAADIDTVASVYPLVRASTR